MSLLEIRNLDRRVRDRARHLRAVDGVDLDVERDEVLGIVGESGSGKSVAMLAVMGLIRRPGRGDAPTACASTARDLLDLAPARAARRSSARTSR